MELQAWIKKEDINPLWVAYRIGISKASIYYYMALPPQRMPSPKHMLAIVRLTRGKVGPMDFYPGCRQAMRKLRNGGNAKRKT